MARRTAARRWRPSPAILAAGVTAVDAFDELLARGVLTGRGVVPRDFVGCDDVLAAQALTCNRLHA